MKKLIYKFFRTLLFVSVLLTGICCFAQSQTGTMTKKEISKWYKSNEWLGGCQLKPHKSTNQQVFAKEYFGNKILWDKTFAWLKVNDLNTLASGRYVIDEGNVTATISEAPAPEMEKVKWETHNNFNDLQYIIKGKANMGVSPVSEAYVTEAYNSKMDATFYETKGKYYVGEPGTFYIFTPADVHRPGIKIEGSDIVKKVVIKIRAVK